MKRKITSTINLTDATKRLFEQMRGIENMTQDEFLKHLLNEHILILEAEHNISMVKSEEE